MEKNTVGDKTIKEDKAANVCRAAEVRCGELGLLRQRTKHQREKDGRQSRQRPRNTCGSSALPLPVHDPLRQLDVQRASVGTPVEDRYTPITCNYLLNRHSLSIYYGPSPV